MQRWVDAILIRHKGVYQRKILAIPDLSESEDTGQIQRLKNKPWYIDDQ